MSLEIELHPETSNGKRLLLIGSLDTDTALQLQKKIDQEINPSVATLILDLEQLKFLSSAGLRVIFKTRKMMSKYDGKLLLLNLQPQIRKVFVIIKALDDMSVFENREELDEYLAAMQKNVLDGDV